MIGNIISNYKNGNSPLFSYSTLLDEDMAVVKYAICNYNGKEAFDLSKIKSFSYFSLLGKVYRRKEQNPLYVILRDDSYKEFADKLYNSLMEDKLKLEDYLVSTEVFNMALEAKKTDNIRVTILLSEEYQNTIVDNIKELSGIPRVYVKNVDTTSYDSIYFKYLDEAKRFKDEKGKNIYISNAGLNLNDTNDDLKDPDFLVKLASQRCMINSFDLYRTSLIGNYTNDKKEKEDNVGN